jgi:hypothetical protein
MVTLHANYIKGNNNKMLRMDEHGFWLALPQGDPLKEVTKKKKVKWSNGCKAFEPRGTMVPSDAVAKGAARQ